MSERLKEPVLKTGVGFPTVGSNPTSSIGNANMVELVDTLGLEPNEVIREGSNPSIRITIYAK